MFALFMVLIFLAWIGMAVGSIWVLVIAGKEGGVHVVLCLFVPFYFFYYVFTRLEQTGVPAAIYGVSVVLMIVFNVAMGAVVGGELAAEPEDGNWFDPPVAQADAGFDPASPPESPNLQPAPGQMPDEGGLPEPEMAEAEAPGDSTDSAVPPGDAPGEPLSEPAGDSPLAEAPAMSVPGDPAMPAGDPAGEGLPIEPVVVEPEYADGWKGDAQRAYFHGRHQDGKRFLQASLIASDDDEIWKSVRYSPLLERPVAALSWGIGLQKVDKVPPHVMAMIRSQQNSGGGGGNAEGGADPALLAQPGEAAPGGDEGGGVQLARPETDAPPELREYTGDIGSRVMGSLPAGGLERLLGTLPEGQTWGKPVEFVGVGEDLKEVISLARQQGMDVAAVAVVTISLRGRIVDASLSVRLIDVATEKRLWTSPTLNSNQVKVAMARGQDPASEMLEEMKGYLESKFELIERPALDKEKVKQRLEKLVSDNTESPLPLLLETRFYQRQGAITVKEAEEYYRSLVGLEESAAMASGTEDQRRQIIQRYLPMPRD
jgi:hypothetical protein